MPYNTALTTWSTYRIFTAICTFVSMSQLIPQSYAYSWSVFTGLNWHLTITYGCLPLAVWFKNIPLNTVSDAFAHLLQHLHFCCYTPVGGTGWSSSPAFRPWCLLIAKRRGEKSLLVQRKQRLHVLLLAFDFFWPFKNSRLHHRLGPAHMNKIWSAVECF